MTDEAEKADKKREARNEHTNHSVVAARWRRLSRRGRGDYLAPGKEKREMTDQERQDIKNKLIEMRIWGADETGDPLTRRVMKKAAKQ